MSMTAFSSSSSCVRINLYVVPGRVYTGFFKPPIAMSFVPPVSYFAGNNSFAGNVTNSKGIPIGQIASDVLVISLNFTEEPPLNLTTICILDSSDIPDQPKYPISDIGVWRGSSFQPLGVSNFTHDPWSSEDFYCYLIKLNETNTTIVLIERMEDYESVDVFTPSEKDVLITTGSFFCIGGVLVILFHIALPFNLATLFVGLQSLAMFLFRGIYFLLLSAEVIPAGTLLDFALIEIPTFFYIGIFLQVIIVLYCLMFKTETFSTVRTSIYVAIALLFNWMMFAGIMIAISLGQNDIVVTKTCNCRITQPVQSSNNAQIIRIVYKSVVLAFAVLVACTTVIAGYRKKYIRKNRLVYFQLVSLSTGLVLDCVAFLIYYQLNKPNPDFAIVLWFTELVPICMLNVMIGWSESRYNIERFFALFWDR